MTQTVSDGRSRVLLSEIASVTLDSISCVSGRLDNPSKSVICLKGSSLSHVLDSPFAHVEKVWLDYLDEREILNSVGYGSK